MKRSVINLLALVVITAGARTLAAQPGDTDPVSGGSCCNADDSTCYLNLNGVIIIQQRAYAC